MEIYTSQASRSALPPEHHVYYSKTRLLLGSVVVLMVLAFCLYMATDPYKKGAFVPLFWGAFALGCAFLFFKNVRAFMNASTPALTISQEGIRFNNGKSVVWSDVKDNTYHTQSYNFITTAKAIKIKRHSGGKAIQFGAMALALSSDEYLHLCDVYSELAHS